MKDKIFYPRIQRELHVRGKLSLIEIEEIKRLRNLGFSAPVLAEKFKVTQQTICYCGDPGTKEKRKKVAAECKRKRLKTDEEFRKRTNQYGLDFIKKRRATEEEFVKFQNSVSNKYYHTKVKKNKS